MEEWNYKYYFNILNGKSFGINNTNLSHDTCFYPFSLHNSKAYCMLGWMSKE